MKMVQKEVYYSKYWKQVGNYHLYQQTHLCHLQEYSRVCSKYYAVKANIEEQSIIIEDVFKIRMLHNLGFIFKTYLTIINNQIHKNEQLKEDKVLLRAIEEEKTRIMVKHNASANFAITKSNIKPK